MFKIITQIEENMRKILLIIVTFLLTYNVNAQNIYEFLRLDSSPRAAALAGSYVSNNDDPNVMFYNPAGIYLLENTPISFSYLNHLLDVNSATISASHEFEGIGRFSGGIQYINYGDFTEADQFGNRTGEFGAGDLALTVGYANQLDENFFYGVNAKFIFSSIAEESSTALAMDLGLQYNIPESNWSFGFSVLNIGTQLSSYFETEEDLPLDMRVGVSKKLEHSPFQFFLSINRINEKEDSFTDRFTKFSFGGEFRLSEVIKLRIGYDNQKRKDLKIGTTAGLAGYNLGLGFKIKEYIVDYSFSSMGSVGSLHRFGVMTSL